MQVKKEYGDYCKFNSPLFEGIKIPMQVKKEYGDYIIHYMSGGNLVSKLLKQLSQKEIDTFVAAKQHLKYFEPKNGKVKTKQADAPTDVEAPTENEA